MALGWFGGQLSRHLCRRPGAVAQGSCSGRTVPSRLFYTTADGRHHAALRGEGGADDSVGRGGSRVGVVNIASPIGEKVWSAC
jgi:hypothetical protein